MGLPVSKLLGLLPTSSGGASDSDRVLARGVTVLELELEANRHTGFATSQQIKVRKLPGGPGAFQ